jgi:hypothetical protein
VNKLLGIAILFAATVTASVGATVEIRIEPHGGMSWTTDSGQTVTVTRLAFLLSDFRLQQNDGHWVNLPGQFAFIDAVQNRLRFRLENVPPDTYQQIAFTIAMAV